MKKWEADRELSSKTSVYASSEQKFWELNNTLRKGICYPIYLGTTAVSELTNNKYNISGRGFFYCGTQPDIMLTLGNGDTILTGRVSESGDSTFFVAKPTKLT